MSLLVAALRRRCPFSLLGLILVLAVVPQPIPASVQLPADPPNPSFMQPQDRITGFVDDEKRVTLHGNRHPWPSRNMTGTPSHLLSA